MGFREFGALGIGFLVVVSCGGRASSSDSNDAGADRAGSGGSAGSNGNLCRPGEQIACSCPNSVGVRRCSASGDGFGACECKNSGGSGGSPGSGGTLGSAGRGGTTSASGGVGGSFGGRGGTGTAGGSGGPGCDPGTGLGTPAADCEPFDPGETCQECVKARCCTEWRRCIAEIPDNVCGWGGPAGEGEIICFQNCVLEAGVASDEVMSACAGRCVTPGCPTIGAETNDLIACLSSNCIAQCLQL